jgi:hypothetical protein
LHFSAKPAEKSCKELATLAEGVPEEVLYEHGQGEAAGCRARQAERVSARALLVKIARGQNDSCNTSQSKLKEYKTEKQF